MGTPPPGKPFVKGTSGNKRGRPRSFARFIREQTDGGREMVITALAIMRGEMVIRDSRVVDKQLVDVDTWADHRTRLAAVQFLTEQSEGKPMQSVHVVDAEGAAEKLDLSQVSDETLDALEAALPETEDGAQLSDEGGDSGGEGETEPQ